MDIGQSKKEREMSFFVILDVSLRLVGRILLSDVECLNEYPYIMVKGVILPQGSKDLGKSLLWGESKLVKTVCSDSLIPHFVNNGYVKLSSLVALHMHVRRYSLGHGFCVCMDRYRNSTHKVVGITAVSWLCPLGQ